MEEQGSATPVYGVTGATGALGRLATHALLARVGPAQVVAIVRDPTKAADLRTKGVAVRVATYDDPAALTAALAGVEKLLLISGSEAGQRIQQHRNVIDAAKQAGVKHLAYTSILHADTSTNPLAPEHAATEDYIVASGLPYSFLRHGWYTENYAETARTAWRTGTLLTSAGEGKVASATRGDYAAADIASLLHDQGYQVHELAGDYAWSFAGLAEVIGRIGGRSVNLRNVSAEEHVAALESAGLPREAAQFVAALDSSIARGELADTSGELARLIGTSTTPLEAGLRKALQL